MTRLEESLAELRGLLQSTDDAQAVVKRFQAFVWESDEFSEVGPEVAEVLGDLAYDLEFFEGNDSFRRQVPELFGESRLQREIGEALKKLRELGQRGIAEPTPDKE